MTSVNIKNHPKQAYFNPTRKIINSSGLSELLSSLPRPFVFTNGVFDIIHTGHVSCLANARSMGATLIVGLNSDKSVHMLEKGDNRPFNSECDRAVVLSALEAVDVVTIFDERTPIQLVERIRPDIYVKGGDYDIDKLDEAKLVRSWGGMAFSLPFIEGHSTTTLVSRIADASKR